MKSNSKKTAAHHHESQSNQNKKNRSRDWLESQEFWKQTKNNLENIKVPDEQSETVKIKYHDRKRTLPLDLQQITEEQFTDLMKTHGLNAVETSEKQTHLLVPKAVQDLKSSNKSSIIDNFNDYSHLEQIMGEQISQIIQHSIDHAIKDKIHQTKDKAIGLKLNISYIKNQLFRMKSDLQKFLYSLQRQLMEFWFTQLNKLQSEFRAELLQLRQKQIDRHKLESTSQDQRGQKVQIYNLNVRIKQLQIVNQQLIENMQIQHKKDKLQYVKTLQKFSLQVENLADQIYEIKQKQVEKQQALKKWENQLIKRQKHLQQRIKKLQVHPHRQSKGFKTFQNQFLDQQDNSSIYLTDSASEYQMNQLPCSARHESQFDKKIRHNYTHFSPNRNKIEDQRKSNSYEKQDRLLSKFSDQYKKQFNKISNFKDQKKIARGNNKQYELIVDASNQYKNKMLKYSNNSYQPIKNGSLDYQEYYRPQKIYNTNGNSKLINEENRQQRFGRGYKNISQINRRLKMIQKSMNKDLNELKGY